MTYLLIYLCFTNVLYKLMASTPKWATWVRLDIIIVIECVVRLLVFLIPKECQYLTFSTETDSLMSILVVECVVRLLVFLISKECQYLTFPKLALLQKRIFHNKDTLFWVFALEIVSVGRSTSRCWWY